MASCAVACARGPFLVFVEGPVDLAGSLFFLAELSIAEGGGRVTEIEFQLLPLATAQAVELLQFRGEPGLHLPFVLGPPLRKPSLFPPC
jgi:hypothetical protein